MAGPPEWRMVRSSFRQSVPGGAGTHMQSAIPSLTSSTARFALSEAATMTMGIFGKSFFS